MLTATPTPTTTAPSSRSRAPGRARGGASSPGAREARARIDLRRHDGVHPRVGALDVAPIVYLDDHAAAPRSRRRCSPPTRSAREGLPVYLYGALAGGRTRAELRRGGPEALIERRRRPTTARRACTRPRARRSSPPARR